MKILILTASPVRDAYIDGMIGDELRKRGHEVFIHPCLRGGREKILEIQPDVTVFPPIRNPFARDTVNQAKEWGVGIVTRHTEASLDWNDWKHLTPQERSEIMGQFPYHADVELIWGPDEAEILQRRGCPFPVLSVGSFIVDLYKREDFETIYLPKEAFREKYKLAKDRSLLFASCWSFADTAPDLRVDSMDDYTREREGREQWIKMANYAHDFLQDDWNILLKVHPGEKADEYQERLNKGITVIVEQSSPDTLKNVDILVHAGSTMAVEAHILGIPAYQFCDISKLNPTSWYTRTTPLSRVSPRITKVSELIKATKDYERKSNADQSVLEELEKGRFGSMDGKATARAADEIEKIKGKFKLMWPMSPFNYETDKVKRSPSGLIEQFNCGICKRSVSVMKGMKGNFWCPWCGARLLRSSP